MNPPITIYSFIQLIETEIPLDGFDPKNFNRVEFARKIFVLANQFSEEQRGMNADSKIKKSYDIDLDRQPLI